MDNENFRPDKADEEYHFSETDNTTAFTDLPPIKKNILERIDRKNVIIAIAVIVAVFVVYKLVSSIFTSSSTQQSKPARPLTTNTQSVVTPPAAQQISPLSSQQSPPIGQHQTAVTTAINEKLTALEANSQANLDKLSSQVTSLQNTLSNLEERLNSLNNTVQDMVNQQQQQLAKKVQAQEKLRAKKMRAVTKSIYFVRAIVPGRAWLLTQSGSTVTVSVGANLPGYGTVVLVDPNQGTVTTSSGAIIGYSPGDS